MITVACWLQVDAGERCRGKELTSWMLLEVLSAGLCHSVQITTGFAREWWSSVQAELVYGIYKWAHEFHSPDLAVCLSFICSEPRCWNYSGTLMLGRVLMQII